MHISWYALCIHQIVEELLAFRHLKCSDALDCGLVINLILSSIVRPCRDLFSSLFYDGLNYNFWFIMGSKCKVENPVDWDTSFPFESNWGWCSWFVFDIQMYAMNDNAGFFFNFEFILNWRMDNLFVDLSISEGEIKSNWI